VLPLASSFGTRHRLKQRPQGLVNHFKLSTASPTPVPPQLRGDRFIEAIQANSIKHLKLASLRKMPLTILPFSRTRVAKKAFRGILFFVIVALMIGMFVVLMQDGFSSMKNIVIYSAMGFFTFFMGYFGMMFAKDIIDIVLEKKNSNKDADINT
jgi:membrane glycosyltransferase